MTLIARTGVVGCEERLVGAHRTRPTMATWAGALRLLVTIDGGDADHARPEGDVRVCSAHCGLFDLPAILIPTGAY